MVQFNPWSWLAGQLLPLPRFAADQLDLNGCTVIGKLPRSSSRAHVDVQQCEIARWSLDLTYRESRTGASGRGLGYFAAYRFASLPKPPSNLILACRSEERGRSAAASISSATGFSAIEVWLLDLDDFACVKTFVKRALELKRLDAVIQNAGVSSSEWHTSKDGYESSCVFAPTASSPLDFLRSLQVNVVAPAYITAKLLTLMKQTSGLSSTFKPHVVFVASDAHHRAQFKESQSLLPLATLNNEAKFVAWDRYPVCKLLTVLVAREMCKSSDGRVVVGLTNPGMARTDLDREMVARGEMGVMAKGFQYLLGRSAWSASRLLLQPLLLGNETEVAYLDHGQPSEPSDWCMSAEAGAVQDRVAQELLDLFRAVDKPARAQNL